MTTLHILGANSFIGANVGRYIQNLPSAVFSVILYGRNDLDLLSPELVDRFFSSIKPNDSVLVAAAVSRLSDNSYQCFKDNCDMAANLATSIKEHGSENHVIYLSSIDVYGQQTHKQSLCEQSALAPEDYYACSKVAGEYFFKIALKQNPELLSIFRLTGIYGPNDQGKSLVGLFTRRLFDKKGITLFSGGISLRDYVHVDDLAKIINRAIEQRISGVFNVATGISSSIKEIAEASQKLICPDDNQLTISDESNRNYDLDFDITKLHDAFPDIKFRSIEQGIADYINNH
jgi:nucleoside-diphosphate-sugar epimerase